MFTNCPICRKPFTKEELAPVQIMGKSYNLDGISHNIEPITLDICYNCQKKLYEVTREYFAEVDNIGLRIMKKFE